jgi:hypothetical protein
MPEIVQEPIRLDPNQTAKELVSLMAELDTMNCGPDSRPLMDFVQDKLLPVIQKMHTEATGTMFYVGQHEDRIQALEESEESQLLPEDADHLLEYLTKSLAVLETMPKEAKLAGVNKLIEQGKKSIEFVNSITLDDDDGDADSDSSDDN